MNCSNYNNKIAIVIPYFGRWPSYFNIYVKGCENNKWLTVIFFTDCSIPENYPENLIFIPYTLPKLNQLINDKLNTQFNIKDAYKLCDFRPCYGLIFENYLNSYDYWGYGDIDLLYGDLKPFIIDRLADDFDVLSNRSEILSGSLSIFRNTDYLKKLFLTSSKLIELLSSVKYEGLDETAHNHSTWTGNNKINLPNHCFTYLIAKAQNQDKIKASFITTCKEEINKGETINFNEGKIYFRDISLGYYHYVCNKNNYQYIFADWKDVPARFFITDTGFYIDYRFFWFINTYRKTIGLMKKTIIRIWKRLY